MAERVNTNGTTALYFLFTDHLGSTSVLVDSSGAEVSRQLYRTFGAPRYSTLKRVLRFAPRVAPT